MLTPFMKLFFRILSFLLRKADQHSLDYYKYISSGRLKVENSARFKYNSSVVFLDGNKNSLIKFGSQLEVRQHCVFTVYDAGNILIGDNCFFNNACTLTSLGKIQIGNNCLFGEGVRIYDHNHKYKDDSVIRNQGFTIGEVIIGDNCWIGSNCLILNNVTIGDNVVIGANTLVYKSIESNSVVRTSQGFVSNMYR